MEITKTGAQKYVICNLDGAITGSGTVVSQAIFLQSFKLVGLEICEVDITARKGQSRKHSAALKRHRTTGKNK